MVKVPEATSSGFSFLPRARAARSTMARAMPRKLSVLRLVDDGHDQPPIERDGDAQVDVLVVANRISFDRGVHDRHLAQGDDDGAGDETACR